MATTTTITTRTESPNRAEREKLAEQARLARIARGWWDPNYYADPRNATYARSIAPPGAGDLSEAQFNRLQIAAQASAISPGMANRMIEVLTASPTISPGVATSLAAVADRAAFSQQVMDKILSLDAEAQAAQMQGRNPEVGSEAEKGGWLSRNLKNISRPLFALASLPVETIWGAVRNSVGLLSDDPEFESDIDNPWEFLTSAVGQSTGGQYLGGVFDGPGGTSADLGQGWLPGGDVQQRAEVAMREAAPLVFNEHWTLGRQVGSMLYDNPNDLGYRNLSGMVDLTAYILTDPTVLLGGAGIAAATVRASARTAEAINVGQQVGRAQAAREIIQLSEDTANALIQAGEMTVQMRQVANEAARSANHLYAASQKTASGAKGNQTLEELALRRDMLSDQLRTATDDLAAVRSERAQAPRQTREAREAARGADERLTRTREEMVEQEATRMDTDMMVAIDNLTTALGDEGLDAMQAKVLADSPELPGPFTDAAFIPTRRTSSLPNALPGADGGQDAVLLWKSEQRPNLRSVDDAVDDPDAIIAAVRKGQPRSHSRRRAVKELTSILTRPGSTYTDLLTYAAANNLGQAVMRALRASDIDGITDVFRLTGGEGGVWWTSRNVQTARWSHEAPPSVTLSGTAPVAGSGRIPASTWRTLDESVSGNRERLRAIRAEIKSVDADIKATQRRVDAETKATSLLADQYVAATDLRTSIADSAEALRNSIEYAVGVRRQIGGKPEVSYTMLREWLVGPTRQFDAMVDAGAAVPKHLRAAEAGSRAITALTTMGVSEVARIAGRSVDGFATKAREAVFAAMVKLTDTPENLGLLHRMTSGRIDPEILRAILRADSEEAVLGVIGPAVGVGITRPLSPGVLNALPARINAMSHGRANNHIFNKAQNFIADRFDRWGSVAPRFGAHMNFTDPLGSANVLRNYLNNLPDMSPEFVDSLLGRYLNQTTEVGRSRATMKIMDQVTDHLVEYNAGIRGLSDETRTIMKNRLRGLTRLYEGGRTDVNTWWNKAYAGDAKIGYGTVDGQLIHFVGPQLEAELARGGVLLPDMDEVRRAVGRWGAFLQTHGKVKKALDYVDWGMDIWRSAVLFRLAYTVRNIGEMQFRMFLSGHRSVFNDPLGSLAMASALNKETRFSRGFVGRMAKYNETADGKTLARIGDEDIDATDDLIGEFQDLMNYTGSRHDQRSVRAVQMSRDLRPVRVDQPGFDEGWADQLISLRASRLARVVAGYNPDEIAQAVARGVERETAVVDWVMNSSSTAGMRREYAESMSELSRIFADPKALRDFLFDSPASIRARIMEYTGGGNPDLVDFIVSGRLVREGEESFTMSTKAADVEARQELMASRASRLGVALRPYKADMPDDYKIQMRVVTPGNRTPRRALDHMFDVFFEWNGRKENAWAIGPEFSYAYTDALVDLMPAMSKADRDSIAEFVLKNEKWRPTSEVSHRVRAYRKLTDDGPLTMEDVERVAARNASEHVKGLFYDAAQRKQMFHSLRLVFPFAQPFVDTLWRWGRLMAARPYMIERFGRLGEALTEEGSGVIYDDFDWIDPFTERESRDPTQGFIWTDPLTGEQKFTFPLIGSVLGAALSPIAGFNVAESMQLSAPVQNLNLAFQGDVDFLPGVGPLISFPASQIMPDDWFGAMPDFLRSYMFPYGEPNPSQGVIESNVLPSWARRLTGVLWNEDFRSYSYKGMLAYMASTRDYPGLRSNPQVQQQLIDDVQGGARILTFIRALGAAVLPAAPTQEIYAADRDGRLIGSTYLSDYWYHLLKESDYDYEASTQAFVDTYGMQALSAIVPSSEGEASISGPGWEFFKKHPQKSKAYGDVIGLFFPGDLSLEANTFQTETGDREKLNVEERTQRMLSFMYQAEKTQIEGRAAREQWNVNQIDMAEDDLKLKYGDVVPNTFTGVDSRARLDMVRRAVSQFPELAATRGGEGAQLLFEAYDEFEEQSQYRHGSGLSSQAAEDLRNMFLDEVDRIVADYGGFNATEGGVENIARLFINTVTPRG